VGQQLRAVVFLLANQEKPAFGEEAGRVVGVVAGS